MTNNNMKHYPSDFKVISVGIDESLDDLK